MGEFRMPSLGADMVAGTLTEWYKHPGDQVHRGDIIAAVDTDKGEIDIEAFEDGVLERVVVGEGEKVPVGAVLALIRAAEEPGTVSAAPPAAPPAPAPAPTQAPARAEPSLPASEKRVRVSPLARRLAAERGVDLTAIRGSGPGGAIRVQDVEAATPVAEAAAPVAEGRQDRMRRAIAAAMARSKREIPHFYLATTLDFGVAQAWLAEWNAGHSPTERLLPAVLLLKATALALREYPELNARWENDRVIPAGEINVGVATYLRGGGLVVPALHQVDRRSLPELMRDLRDAVQRARSGNLRSSDLADGTITVTSLGERGADTVLGVIYPPQTAVVGFGAIVERPWAVAGAVGVRPVLTASLAADHRASDGRQGAAFLAAVSQLLQSPERL
ncbi:MAG TPA: dihydrolipoamide acetyltransferase family protein [Gemmatimonadales bacterium]|nr:dihydrolipoamide acetyltransferase family protein [Gemmatimonadales bacterium]